MTLNRRTVVIGAAIGALAVAGVGAGIAQAVGGSSEDPVTGPAAEQAKAAALKAAGGGTVLEVEQQDGDGAGLYEVEVRRATARRSRSISTTASSRSGRPLTMTRAPRPTTTQAKPRNPAGSARRTAESHGREPGPPGSRLSSFSHLPAENQAHARARGRGRA